MLNIFVLGYFSKNVTTTKYQIALIKQNAPCRTHLFFHFFSFLYGLFYIIYLTEQITMRRSLLVPVRVRFLHKVRRRRIFAFLQGFSAPSA